MRCPQRAVGDCAGERWIHAFATSSHVSPRLLPFQPPNSTRLPDIRSSARSWQHRGGGWGPPSWLHVVPSNVHVCAVCAPVKSRPPNSTMRLLIRSVVIAWASSAGGDCGGCSSDHVVPFQRHVSAIGGPEYPVVPPNRIVVWVTGSYAIDAAQRGPGEVG